MFKRKKINWQKKTTHIYGQNWFDKYLSLIEFDDIFCKTLQGCAYTTLRLYDSTTIRVYSLDNHRARLHSPRTISQDSILFAYVPSMRLLAIYEICFGIGGLRICLGSARSGRLRWLNHANSGYAFELFELTLILSLTLFLRLWQRLRRFSIFPFARRHQNPL